MGQPSHSADGPSRKTTPETNMPMPMPKIRRMTMEGSEKKADLEHVIAECRAGDGNHDEKGGKACRDARHH